MTPNLSKKVVLFASMKAFRNVEKLVLSQGI